MKDRVSGISFRTLCTAEINRNLLSSFSRRQEVTDCLRKEDGKWVIRKDPFIDDWNEKNREELLENLRHVLSTGGMVYGAFKDSRLKGFAAVEGSLKGSRKQYADIAELHVSAELRHQGIGRQLFLLSLSFARSLGAEKLYISAHSAVESQAFYAVMGCTEAKEYLPEHAIKEPYDRQLEYVIK